MFKVGDNVIVYSSFFLIDIREGAKVPKREVGLEFSMKVKMVEGNTIMLVMNDSLGWDGLFSVYTLDDTSGLWHKLDEHRVLSDVGVRIELARVS